MNPKTATAFIIDESTSPPPPAIYIIWVVILNVGSANARSEHISLIESLIDCKLLRGRSALIDGISQYFHIDIVRIEQFKDYCNFVNIEYKNILGFLKTHWLSLHPAVSRIIDLCPALKSYFMSQERCPTVLRTFFNDPVSLAWLYFIQSQLRVVCDTIKKIEGDHISASEVYEELEVLSGKIKNRKSQHFFTSELAQLISDLDIKSKKIKLR